MSKHYDGGDGVDIEFRAQLVSTAPNLSKVVGLPEVAQLQDLLLKYGEGAVLESIAGLIFAQLEEISDTENAILEVRPKYVRPEAFDKVYAASERTGLIIYAVAQTAKAIAEDAKGRKPEDIVFDVSDTRAKTVNTTPTTDAPGNAQSAAPGVSREDIIEQFLRDYESSIKQ